MNKVILIGNLTKDAELTFTPGVGKAVAKATIAVSRMKNKDGQQETDFINLVMWEKKAEALANYTHKGMKIAVVCKIQTRNYENKDGNKVYITEVICDEWEFVEKKESGQVSNNNNSTDGFVEMDDSSEIPF